MRPNRNKKPKRYQILRLGDIEKAKVDEFNNQLNKWEHGKTTLEKQIQSFEAKVKHNQATIDLKVEAMMDGKVKDVECKAIQAEYNKAMKTRDNLAKELKSLRDLLIDHASTKPNKYSGYRDNQEDDLELYNSKLNQSLLLLVCNQLKVWVQLR